MINNSKNMTKYLRSAVAAQANMTINFKVDSFHLLNPEELIQGKVNTIACKDIFSEAKKFSFDNKKEKKDYTISVIICAKTIKTIFEANEKTQNEIEELTGVYYIPAILNSKGFLQFDAGKRLPWFPREYMKPMIEPRLAIGNAEAVDNFVSNNVDKIEKIKSWSDYVKYFVDLFESVTESKFHQKTIRNLDEQEPFFELENNMYIFIDNTVNSTFHIMNLYNHLLKDEQAKPLYDNFISTSITNTRPLIVNGLSTMQAHCGQMGGKYPLSSSQREAINHFNYMSNGEILAVNGPPGTGKTTLLQTIVADMYVNRAIKEENAPLIVASSTNNQAVTNIITSFGDIEKVGISNLERRWIQGANSFATYFPSASKMKEAKIKGYHYTNQKGEFFVSDLEDEENIKKSTVKLIQNCNAYFKSEYTNIKACQDKLHEELLYIEKSKITLLSLAHEVSKYDLNGSTIDAYLKKLSLIIEENNIEIQYIKQRIKDWESCYKRIPFFYRTLRFLRCFSKKIEIEFRLFINNEEQSFLDEYMSIDEVKEKYSQIYAMRNKTNSTLKLKKTAIEKIKKQYDNELKQLKHHNIEVMYAKEDEKYNLELDHVNSLLDKNHRYMEFWLAVHYFECRWVNGENKLSPKQRGTNFEDVLNMFYNRLSMITPCFVMTFFMLPKQFLAYKEQKNFFLYNHIDLLIVDEAGQVSPDIAAPVFSLAKKSVVCGDVYQIEPIWSVNRALDKALAISNEVIESRDEFKYLEQTGINCSCSSVMKVAAKCCKYEKYNEKGLFLSEHRRCYNEIIDYCNRLVYKGNLQPMRGEGRKDDELAIKEWPQMGLKQIDTDYSRRKGSSRLNRFEAEEIAEWLKNNYKIIVNAYPKENKKNLVGIITPFNAQVNCIKSEIKKQLPTDYTKVSVGTVHTFQGAERRIIILSTVYGKHDGCFFIDANSSLMNVAVSRAKDYFFVFGDINCLKDTPNSASGLLKTCILDRI